ncbi:ABC transporter, ATP binding protein [Synechococcus sp. WH 8109]|nr:ABC transporter, ATP binding protein [Synechococcus sp. WH 8109]
MGKSFKLYKSKAARLKQIINGQNKRYYKEFIALEDISFEVSKGTALAIIGKNGSGKSTLLQIICGIVSPTQGSVQVKGKVAALLELGSGFNPEFTGRENIYLNATLFGLSKKQIDERFDAIVKFSEIGDFIDEPTKTYSSGMVVRLAFSIITNVDADILIVDEALSVGDAFFTQKCMRFIERFRKDGTLIFVSHDANAVLSLCDQALLLKDGKNTAIGTPKEVMEVYTKQLQSDNEEERDLNDNINGYPQDSNRLDSLGIGYENQQENIERLKWSDYRKEVINASKYANRIEISNIGDDITSKESYGGKKAKIIEILIKNHEKNGQIETILGGEIVELVIICRAEEEVENLITGFILKNNKGLTLLGDNTLNAISSGVIKNAAKGDIIKTKFIFTLPLLSQGDYSITTALASGSQSNHEILHWLNDAIVLHSRCTSIAAGLAGVPMHAIEIEKV